MLRTGWWCSGSSVVATGCRLICEELIDLAPSSALGGTDVEIRSFGFSARASEDHRREFNGTTAAVVSQVTKVETRLLDCKL